ncbi:hypothetical protein AJ85_21040 [Alkalihalobacillus alcalophilus ATCC 27647 = CGMCC 1.3604]|uniref:Uncharacterized protein n=1 Tax=Alkalihalobacillus alcalophilus ATCC 27647 = CGMCC 1.3604 TaxID=1218173 RepID=A0A094XCB1_ALKAL|nr:YwnF family protein [Alkalihalobacillus alcalophilus]KGA96430.1 hypothetical protein BALCAV_0216175 [Alkalihalobacillus alcalophilus ATCC 27647 = CGMCC 1.3604]MED1562871.1 YwnF family protein [Alkalihalobacillus alcalophilus]THG88826.1 hypothetical protein AJ85_21040 [Alkalihalobacillus alcalophilus ATCC 27647 = CGMCC 1.3604]
MNPFSIRQAPEFIQKEIQEIQEHIAPMLKKSLGFSFVSFPLIGFSIINIFFLVAIVPDTAPKMIPIVLYAILGALGFALLKESSIKTKEVHRTGIAYMKNRIEKSSNVMEDVKKRYIRSLEEEPQQAINVFCEFLTYEHNRSPFKSN